MGTLESELRRFVGELDRYVENGGVFAALFEGRAAIRVSGEATPATEGTRWSRVGEEESWELRGADGAVLARVDAPTGGGRWRLTVRAAHAKS